MKKKPPNTKAIFAIIVFLLLGALGLLAGAAWTYHDEHSGTATTAHVTHCIHRRSGKGNIAYCTANWTINGRTVTGDVYNANSHDAGKDVSVRVHGNRATKPQLWVSIGLAIFGLAIGAVGVWLLSLYRTRFAQPT